jgi:hypothetical protein
VGAYVTGGGYAVAPDLTGFVYASAAGGGDPNPGNSWLVSAFATTSVMTVTGYAVCATRHLTAQIPHTHTFYTIPPLSEAGAALSCPNANQLLTSGGYLDSDPSPPAVLIAINSPESASAGSPTPITEWLVGGSNPSTVSHRVFLWAICATVNA